jgi:hypothetical protein
MSMALLASIISIRLGIAVALVEMFVGVIGGNFFGFHTTPWIDFLATFGSGLLPFSRERRSIPNRCAGTSSQVFWLAAPRSSFPFWER